MRIDYEIDGRGSVCVCVCEREGESKCVYVDVYSSVFELLS